MNKRTPRKKKPNVVQFPGLRGNEVVPQSVLQELELAQIAEWHAGKRAALLSEQIRLALKRGATVEPGKLYFDGELEMVRTRRKEA